MAQDTAPPETIGSIQTEFLRQLPQEFEDLVQHWHIVRKRSCPLQEIRDLRVRTEKLVDQLRDKRVDRLLDRVRRLDERLQFPVRTQQPLSRTEVEAVTSTMMALRQAGIEGSACGVAKTRPGTGERCPISPPMLSSQDFTQVRRSPTCGMSRRSCASSFPSRYPFSGWWIGRVDLLQGNFLRGPDRNLAYDPVL